MRRVASLLVALAPAACSVEPSGPASPSAPPSATVATVLEPGAFPPRSTPTPLTAPTLTPRPTVPLAPVRINVVRLNVPEGEDGYGHTVPAIRPAAIDLVTEGGWHAGGLATTMTIGDRRFHNMGYPSITTMRFIVADEGALPRDAEVALEVGSSVRRRVLAPSLPVAR
jgi:hypothetical protein